MLQNRSNRVCFFSSEFDEFLFHFFFFLLRVFRCIYYFKSIAHLPDYIICLWDETHETNPNFCWTINWISLTFFGLGFEYFFFFARENSRKNLYALWKFYNEYIGWNEPFGYLVQYVCVCVCARDSRIYTMKYSFDMDMATVRLKALLLFFIIFFNSFRFVFFWFKFFENDPENPDLEKKKEIKMKWNEKIKILILHRFTLSWSVRCAVVHFIWVYFFVTISFELIFFFFFPIKLWIKCSFFSLEIVAHMDSFLLHWIEK